MSKFLSSVSIWDCKFSSHSLPKSFGYSYEVLLQSKSGPPLSNEKSESISSNCLNGIFLNSDHCPNFVKAGVEKAKIHVDDELINNEDENDRFNSSVFDNSNQPEWMELVHPNKQFEEIDSEMSEIFLQLGVWRSSIVLQ
jgi:hypothetical protein